MMNQKPYTPVFYYAEANRKDVFLLAKCGREIDDVLAKLRDEMVSIPQMAATARFDPKGDKFRIMRIVDGVERQHEGDLTMLEVLFGAKGWDGEPAVEPKIEVRKDDGDIVVLLKDATMDQSKWTERGLNALAASGSVPPPEFITDNETLVRLFGDMSW